MSQRLSLHEFWKLKNEEVNAFRNYVETQRAMSKDLSDNLSYDFWLARFERYQSIVKNDGENVTAE